MNTRTMVMNAVIAAVYAALTLALAPLSYGPIQVRLSEWMTLLAFVNPRLVPGLVIGCALANLASPFGAIDIIVGTLATLLAVYGMRFVPNIFLASLLPVISNGVIIGLELAWLGALDGMALPLVMAYIALGEFVAVSIIGVIVIRLLLRSETIRHYLGV